MLEIEERIGQNRTGVTRPVSQRQQGFSVRRWFLVAGVILAVLAFFAQRLSSRPGTVPVAEGTLAPEFTLPAANGGTVSLSDFVGKRHVLLFFSMGSG